MSAPVAMGESAAEAAIGAACKALHLPTVRAEAAPLADTAAKERLTHRAYLVYGLIGYAVAKVFEFADHAIFEATSGAVSGHTLKHLLAALAPFFVEQRSALDDGLLRDWPRPDSGVEKHEAYALQWYSLAALAVVLAAVFSFKKIERPA